MMKERDRKLQNTITIVGVGLDAVQVGSDAGNYLISAKPTDMEI